jgi:glycosyltransferase involved in cell wall biosynthesis
MDTQDPVLGFFTRWVEEIAERTDSVNVICLKEGAHLLPDNLRVHSLGKESGVGKLAYVWRFYCYIWSLRRQYDAVFVHMNEEYILLGGIFWKLFRKPIYMWRNHYAGSWRTRLAAFFCTKIFCTSKHSFTAQFKKTILMPVGIDLDRFASQVEVPRPPRSILFLARIAPSKRPEMLIDALGSVLASGISFTADIVGSPLPDDESYAESLAVRAEALGLHDRVRFLPGVPNATTPAIYRAHDIFVNCSPSGMFDKTLFEAAACGCRVIASSDDFHDSAGDEAYAPDTEALASRLIDALDFDEDMTTRTRIRMQALARAESIGTLMDRICTELSEEGR